jgi:hypothetical protein
MEVFTEEEKPEGFFRIGGGSFEWRPAFFL